MSKKNKHKHQPSIRPDKALEQGRPGVIPSPISKRGWKAIGAGIGLLIVGYIVLSKADSMAQNWAGIISPFLILGGYAIIGIGIILKDPTP